MDQAATLATPRFIAVGSAEYRRAIVGLCASGFSTFALLYCVQPMLPIFSRSFALTAAESSLSLSVSTMVLTMSIFLSGIASERFGRKPIMTLSLFGTGLLTLGCAVAPSWHVLLVLRLLEGVTAGGVPAVAMAYLAEEIEPVALGSAMGIYIAGNAFGGMLGRLLAGAIAQAEGWRVAMAALALMGLAAAAIFVRVLPPSRHFRPSGYQSLAMHGVVFARLLRRRRLKPLLLVGFLAAGPFVAVYNYAGYRLIAPPFSLSQTALGAIFLVYVFGIVGSTASGRCVARLGRGPTMVLTATIVLAGVLVTLAPTIPLIVAGIAMLTFGFFGLHTVASAWVGQLGGRSKGHASALYLFCFYAGLSVLGSSGGWFWGRFGWTGVAGMAAVLASALLCLAISLGREPTPVV